MSTPTRTRPTTTAAVPAVITSPATSPTDGALSRAELNAQVDRALAAYLVAAEEAHACYQLHRTACAHETRAWATYTAAVAAERDALADTAPPREG